MKFYFLNNLFVNKILFLNKIILNKNSIYIFHIKIQYILSAEKLDKTKELNRKTTTKKSPITLSSNDTTVNIIGYFISSLLF